MVTVFPETILKTSSLSRGAEQTVNITELKHALEDICVQLLRDSSAETAVYYQDCIDGSTKLIDYLHSCYGEDLIHQAEFVFQESADAKTLSIPEMVRLCPTSYSRVFLQATSSQISASVAPDMAHNRLLLFIFGGILDQLSRIQDQLRRSSLCSQECPRERRSCLYQAWILRTQQALSYLYPLWVSLDLSALPRLSGGEAETRLTVFLDQLDHDTRPIAPGNLKEDLTAIWVVLRLAMVIPDPTFDWSSFLQTLTSSVFSSFSHGTIDDVLLLLYTHIDQKIESPDVDKLFGEIAAGCLEQRRGLLATTSNELSRLLQRIAAWRRSQQGSSGS